MSIVRGSFTSLLFSLDPCCFKCFSISMDCGSNQRGKCQSASSILSLVFAELSWQIHFGLCRRSQQL